MPVRDAVISADGSRAFVLYTDRLVARDVDSGVEREIATGLSGTEDLLVASIDGRRVSLRFTEHLMIWDADNGAVVRQWDSIRGDRARMAPNGEWIIDRPRENRYGLEISDINTGRSVCRLFEETKAEKVRVSPDSRWVAALSLHWGDEPFAVWDTATGKLLPFSLTLGFVGEAEFRGRWLVSFGLTGGIAIWDVPAATQVFRRDDYKRVFTALAPMPDDRWMVVGFGDGRLGTLDLTDGSAVRRLPGHTERVVAIAVTPRDTILSASVDGVLQATDCATSAVAATFRIETGISALVLRSDGRTVVAVDRTGSVHRIDYDKKFTP